MQFNYFLNLTVILTVIATTTLRIEARHLKLRALSAKEVYRILREAGREDAVPEGRVVTQAIAAMTGFSLGVNAGINGAMLYNMATSNATSEFIKNVTQMFNGGSTSGSDKQTSITFQTQEICFKSRSRQGRNAEYDENDDAIPTTPTGRIKYPVTSTNGTTSGSGSSGSGTSGTAPTGSATSSTTPSGSGTTSGSGTSDGTNTSTKFSEFTQIDNGDKQTCIVVQTPTIRRRRSLHHRRH